MLNTRLLYVFALLALIMAACGNGVTSQPSNANSDNNSSSTTGGESSGNGLSNSRFDSITITNDPMSLPNEEPMTVFAQSDNFINVPALILNIKAGDEFTIKIIAINAPDFDLNGLINGTNISTMPYDKDKEGSQTTLSFFDKDGEWPIGSYKVEAYYNGNLDTVFKFIIQ